jgi:hypothetical protein
MKKPKPKPKKAKPAKRVAKKKPVAKKKKKPVAKPTNKWLAFVKKHGVVLASARGPVPSVAEAVAGEPIVGSWWAHKKSQAIFDALSTLDDAMDIRSFKLVDGKVTFVHRRLWPALTRLARDGVIAADRVAAVQQEHTDTGEHHNIVTAFPDWVPDEVAAAADVLSSDAAKQALGAWV